MAVLPTPKILSKVKALKFKRAKQAANRAGGAGLAKQEALRARRAAKLKDNVREGLRREEQVAGELGALNPNASIQGQQYLRDATGRIAKDPVTGQARRLDHVVIREGAPMASDVVETTSAGAARSSRKRAQLAKETRIRESGGRFVRDRETGGLVEVPMSRVVTPD